MKRGKKFLILLAALVILIGAALAAPLLTPDTQEEEPETAVTVFTVDTTAITELSWTYGEETLTFGFKDEQWYYTQDSTFPVDSSYLETMAANLAEIVAEKTIEAPENLEDYGLLRPTCTVTVTAGDTTTELLLGDSTAVDGLRYVSIGDGKVYLADNSLYSCFQYGLYDLIRYETIPAMDTVTELSVNASSQALHLQYLEDSGLAYSDSYVWFTENNGELRAVDTELTQTFLASITGMTWDSCANYNADEAALESYGLAEPAIVAEIHYTQTAEEGAEPEELTFTVELGTGTDSQCYARIKGSNMVYLIDDSIADALLYTTYAELQPDEVLSMDWETVASVTVTLDGESYEFERTLKEVTDDDGNTTQEAVYLLNEEEADLQSVLDTLTTMESAGYANGAVPERSAEIQFVFHRNTETFSQVELTFYQYDSANCLTLRDGTATVFVSREDVVDLVEAINALVLG